MAKVFVTGNRTPEEQGYDIMVLGSGWTGSAKPWIYRVEIAGLTSGDRVDVYDSQHLKAHPEWDEACGQADLRAGDQGNGYFELLSMADDKPKTDFEVRVEVTKR